MNKIRLYVLIRPGTKNDCATEDQQKITALFSNLSKYVAYQKLIQIFRRTDFQFVDAFRIHNRNYFCKIKR
jgi:hypothetical protein